MSIFNNAVASFGIFAGHGIFFNLSESTQLEAQQVPLATYAWLKNREAELMISLSNFDTSGKSSEEVTKELSYHKGALDAVRSLIIQVEQAYQTTPSSEE